MRIPRRGMLLCFALPFVIYLHSLANGFSFDDDSVVVKNKLIRSWANVSALFSHAYFVNTGELSYRPLVTLTFFVDYSVWGLLPFGYHFVNMLLHGLNAALLAAVALAWGSSRRAAVAAGLLFAAHALASEVVCAASFREDALASLFMLLTVRLYLCGREYDGAFQAPVVRRFAAIGRIACYALALAAKELALVTLPIVLLCRWTRRRSRAAAPAVGRLEAATQVAVTLGYLFVRFKLMRSSLETPCAAPRSFGVMAWDALRILGVYANLSFFPVRLCSNRVLGDYGPGTALAGLLAAAALGWAWAGKRTRPIGYACTWAALTFLPVSNVVRLRNPVAERHAYAPLLGFAVCLASVLFALPRRGRKLAGGLLAALLIFYAASAVDRVFSWQDDYALSAADILVSPSGPRARHLLGDAYYERGQLVRALWSQKHAVRSWPNYIEAWINGGAALLDSGRPAEAARWFARALRVPRAEVHNVRNYAWAAYNLALAYERMGQWDRAVRVCRDAIRRGYEGPESFVALARMLTQSGNSDAAKKTLVQAAKMYPESGRIQAALGDVWRALGKPRKAAAAYEAAAQLGWRRWTMRINLANTYLDLGRAQEAAQLCQHLLELLPDAVVAHYGLGMALRQLGQPNEAKTHLETFLRYWQGDPRLAENARTALAEITRGERSFP